MAPANYRVSIFKRLELEEWSNDWLVSVTDIEEGSLIAQALVDFERRLHLDNVTFEYYRLSTTAKFDRTFRHVPINLPGMVAKGANEALPLYCTMRVDFSTLDSDPCRKYFRMPVLEGEQADGKFIPAAIAGKQAVLDAFYMTTIIPDNVVSGAGNVTTGATVYPFVQMRQLHRHKRKKLA